MGDKQALMPRLRFPEFREAGEWEGILLSQMATLHKGKGIAKSDIKPDGVQPCIRYGELYTVYGEVIDEVFSKTDISLDDLFLSCNGDVIIPASGETKIDIATAACVMHGNVALGSDLNVIRSKHDGVFLSYQLNGPLRHVIAKVAQGDAVVHLYKANLEKLVLAIPLRKEQQKIADCLSSIDALIAAYSEKIDALKTHKKGLMQQLFPREGETVPRLRFPEFRGAGRWEGRIIGKHIEEYRENSTKQDEFEVLTSARSGLVRQREYYDNSRITDRENIGFNIIPPSYITYRSRSDDRKFFFNENNLGITGIISTYYPVFRILNGSNKFFIELLSHYLIKVGKHSVGTSQTVLSMNELKKIELPIPQKEEQQKIADCLSSLDALIASQTEKLDALKIHKKGLMQQLFPSPEVVI